MIKPADVCLVGAFMGESTNTTELKRQIKRFKTVTGTKPSIILIFQKWGQEFPSMLLNAIWSHGCIANIKWEPFSISLKDILSNALDESILDWAKKAKKFGKQFFLTPMHEFNGRWYPWGNCPEDFRRAWIYLREKFDLEYVKNATWVWCPNEYPWNKVNEYYPGDKYVDWIGIDGYNFGNSSPKSKWRNFADIFQKPIRALSKYSKPIMISEMACAEQGGNKAKWVENAFSLLKSFPSIKAFTWFNINKETDWRIWSSKESLEAFQIAMSDKYYTNGFL